MSHSHTTAAINTVHTMLERPGCAMDSQKQLIPDFAHLQPWHKMDDGQALAEGWNLTVEDGRWQIQHVSEPDEARLGYDKPKFVSDMDAMAYVVLFAMAGSAYHASALYSIGGKAQ